MVEHRLTGWLRPALWFLALAGLLSLAACGGGGSPNNPYTAPPATPPALVISPSPINIFPGTPATLTIVSGTPPFSVFSDTPSVLPLAQSVSGSTIVLLANQVTAATAVVVTVRDAAAQSVPVTVNITPAPLLNSFTFQPSGGDCGNDLCSAQTGTAKVVALGPGGAPLVAREIRFDVVYGPVAFNTGNPATPQAQTITVATDSAGVAQVAVQALANATTQPAQIRATDVTSGNQQIANFNVVNNTTATQSPIVVVPNSANITGPDTLTCSTGFRVDYYVYGGTPPYSVSSTFPQGVTLLNSVVAKSGGFFSAVTNGACVDPLVFTISDSAGKQTTAQLQNVVGTVTPPTPPTPVPVSIAPDAASGACAGTDYTFVVGGGTPPYNVTTAPTMTVSGSGSIFHITATAPAGTKISVSALDSSSPKQTATGTITCN